MQKPMRDFVEICADYLPMNAPIYEFGSLEVAGSESENLRILFEGREYVGADMRGGPGVDVLLDLHSIDLQNNSVGTVICLDTLEHVEYPRQAIKEIFRILNDDGILVLSSVFEFPIHGYPNDFWRFTPEGFRSLLKDFPEKHIFSYGRSDVRPQCVIAVAFKGKVPELDDFLLCCSNWKEWNTAVIQKLVGGRN
ncbi:MAG: methyltransferase domain-containing protein [Luminiphilus sp.]|nr:methyltransferase domain-containing protein [Luminiphilus sp.]